jgi:hypothetical protein
VATRSPAAVGQRRDPVGREERRDLVGVALGQGVDDPRTLERSQVLDQPGQALRRPGQVDDLQAQAGARQRPPVGPQRFRASGRQLLDHVGHDAIVRGGRRPQHGHVVAEPREHVANPPVVRPEVVPPVRDAVRFVDHQQPHRGGEQRQHLVTEARVVQSLGADQQQVELVGGQPSGDLLPLVAIGGVDRVGA